MLPETYLAYLVVLAIFFATPPGSSQILIITNSLRFGLRRSLSTVAGDLTANTLQILAAGFGLVAIIAASANILVVIKWLGVAYLVWYGIRIFMAEPVPLDRETKAASPRKLFTQGFVTSAANPEAVFFFAALFPQFIDPALPLLPQIAILGVTYLIVDGLVLIAMGASAERLLGGLRHRARLLNRLAGSAMIAAAVLLGLKDANAR